MKKFLQKLTTVVGALLLTTTLAAQDYSAPQYAKYGENPDDRKGNIMLYNTFTEAYKAKDFDAATTALKQLLERAPMASQNLYSMGTYIYKRKIATTKDQQVMANYVDSIMILHDLRLKYFAGDAKRGTSYIMTEKLKDYIRYKNDVIDDVVAIANAAIKAAGEKLDFDIIPAYYNFLVAKYNEGEVLPESLIQEYDFLSEELNKRAASESRDEAVKAVDALFMQSGVASCENIEKIYKPKFEANPDDADLVKKIGHYLANNDCKSDFQNVIAEKSYNIEPNAAAAIMLAVAFEEKGDKEKAATYFSEAISLEENPSTKADYCIRAAGASLQNNQAREAADFARKAIEINSENGMAYTLLAQAYAVGASTACGGFARSAVYWLVVDTLVKARNLSEGDATQVENINSLIRTYSGYFPKTDDMFFSDPPIQNGSSYRVNCGWISGSTVARGR